MKHSMLKKRIIGTVLAFVLLLCTVLPAFAAPPTLSSSHYILIDATSGQILAQKNAAVQLAPGGLVKLMTALLTAEKYSVQQLASTKITTTASALAGTVDTRVIRLVSGEQIVVGDCLAAVLVSGANDAANVLAEAVGESISGFVGQMNARATELGATGAVFKNANGLTAEGQVMSPYDVAVIAKALLSTSAINDYFGKATYSIPATNKTVMARELNTTFAMLKSGSTFHYAHVMGGMYGYTTASGHVAFAAAKKDGRTLIAVVMKAETEAAVYNDMKSLLNYGFDGFQTMVVPVANAPFQDAILTKNGVKVGTASFRLANDLTFLLPADASTSSIQIRPNGVPSNIPVNSEASYTADVIYTPTGDILVASVPLVMTKTMDPVQTTPPDGPDSTTSSQTPPATDPSGPAQSGDSSSPAEEPQGGFFSQGFGKFLRILGIVILVILAVMLTGILLFIGVLCIIRSVNRRRRRKARLYARQQAARYAAQQPQNAPPAQPTQPAQPAPRPAEQHRPTFEFDINLDDFKQ